MRLKLRIALCAVSCLIVLCLLSVNAGATDDIITPVLEDVEDWENVEYDDFDTFDIITPVLEDEEEDEYLKSAIEMSLMQSGTSNAEGGELDGQAVHSIYIGMKRNGVFLPDVAIELYDSEGEMVGAATTVRDDYTKFGGLINGVYTLKTVDMPSGYVYPEEKTVVLDNADEIIDISIQIGAELPSTGSCILPIMYCAGSFVALYSLLGQSNKDMKKRLQKEG